jgi:hypothetical protein
VRRDEIKIRPENVDRHIDRLDHLADDPVPAAQEHPPSTSPAPQQPLEYASPETERESRKQRWNYYFGSASANFQNGLVLAGLFFIALLMGIPSRLTALAIVSVLLLCAPGILVLVHLVNNWINRR